MTNKNLFESMEFIDDSYLEKSEKKPVKWLKFTAVAASVCLVFVAAYIITVISEPDAPIDNTDLPIDSVSDPNNQLEGPEFPTDPDVIPDVPAPAPNPDGNIPNPNDTIQREDPPAVFPENPVILRPGDEGYIYPEPVPPEIPDEPTLPDFRFDAVYNDVDGAYSASMPNIPMYFREELSEEELNLLKHVYSEPWIEFSGFAGFDGDGSLLDVRMSTPTQVPNTEINVSASKVIPVMDYVFSDDAEVSLVGDTEVKMYRWEISENKILLDASSVIDGANIHFSVTATAENEEAVRKDFETVIYLSSYWEKLDHISDWLERLKAEYIPEYINESLTLSEAYEVADFGGFMPKNVPDGFGLESARRYKNYLLDYLSGLWTKGYAQIEWNISYMTEADEIRRTSVETVENYDLSLYPIPMAQSVPDELREIVNDPIFDIDELTLDVVYARSRLSGEAGDVDGYRTNFSVLCGDILIEIRTKGVSPEWIFEALTSVK